MENGKQGTGDSKPVNATAQPHLPVFRFLFPAENKWINMYPAVNNYFLQPPFSQGFTACPASASSTCALSATWVADLDQLEANAPGTFIGQLLNVSFFADDNDATGSNRFVSGTLIVRMEKKK